MADEPGGGREVPVEEQGMTRRGWVLAGVITLLAIVLALAYWAGGERPLTRTVVPVPMPERGA